MDANSFGLIKLLAVFGVVLTFAGRESVLVRRSKDRP